MAGRSSAVTEPGVNSWAMGSWGGSVGGSFPSPRGCGGVTYASPEPELHRAVNPGVVATEELTDEELRHDFVGLLLHFPLVTVACVPDPGRDVGEPVETLETFEGLPVGGVFDPGDDLLQLAVEERVVLAWHRR